MANPKSVTTKETEAVNILTNIDSLSLADKAKLFAMLKTDSVVVTQANSEIDAEVKQLTARIETLRKEIEPLEAEIKVNALRIKSLTGKGSAVPGERKERETKVCVECGQGRHADNPKTRACSVFLAKPKSNTVAATQ